MFLTRSLTAFILTFAVVFSAAADNGAAYQAKIEALKKQITKIQSTISKRQSQQGDLTNELKKADKAIAAIAGRIRKAGEDSRTAKNELERLNQREGVLHEQLEQQRDLLNRQLKVAYQSSRSSRAQMLLNQQDPAMVSRMLAYFDAFNQARAARMQEVSTLINELTVIQAQQRETTERLDAALAMLQAEQAALKNTRDVRSATLKKLEKKLSSDKTRLGKLEHDQRELELLLQQLNTVLADIPAAPLEKKPFKSMRGKLPWPAVGSLKAKYNSKKANTHLRWKGMFIGAKLGNNIRAVYHGRVAFADWMNGFGLIMIVDHGDGYMSIYANAQELRKSQGEWVSPGEIIATVGDSGGQKNSGVYFEMRRNGDPINPHRWVKKSIKFVSVQ
ncbi:MAG: peptidoglycan DD-metalloendopeptidase family protein [Pseudomonadota bacterium]